jgi:hypothetical protein
MQQKPRKAHQKQKKPEKTRKTGNKEKNHTWALMGRPTPSVP